MAYKYRRKKQVAGWFHWGSLRFGYRVYKGSEEQDAKLDAPNYWKALGMAGQLFQRVAESMGLDDDDEIDFEVIQKRMDEVREQLLSGEVLDERDEGLARFLEDSEEIEIRGSEVEAMAKFLADLTLAVKGLEDLDGNELAWGDLDGEERSDLVEELGFEFVRDYHGAIIRKKAELRLGMGGDEDEGGDD